MKWLDLALISIAIIAVVEAGALIVMGMLGPLAVLLLFVAVALQLLVVWRR